MSKRKIKEILESALTAASPADCLAYIHDAIELIESEPEPGEFTKFRKQLGKALNLKGILGEDIPPTEFILAEIDRLEAKLKSLVEDKYTTQGDSVGFMAEDANGNQVWVNVKEEVIKELQCQIDWLEEKLKAKEIDIECLTAERDSYFEEVQKLQDQSQALKEGD